MSEKKVVSMDEFLGRAELFIETHTVSQKQKDYVYNGLMSIVKAKADLEAKLESIDNSKSEAQPPTTRADPVLNKNLQCQHEKSYYSPGLAQVFCPSCDGHLGECKHLNTDYNVMDNSVKCSDCGEKIKKPEVDI